jgi:hypothetical protein
MRTTRHLNKDGALAAFSVEATYIGRRRTTKLLRSKSGVSNVRVPGFSSSDFGLHIAFEYLGGQFEVLEPWGDHPEFIISPKNQEDTLPQIEDIHALFEQYKPTFIRKLAGDFFSIAENCMDSLIQKTNAIVQRHR